MLVLGIETSCDETGIGLFDTEQGLVGHALHSQVDLHATYGGVVPELASRDHIRRLTPLLRDALREAGRALADIDAVAYTQGPGLAGALLTGASFACGLATALNVPTLGVHHLEGHLLAPLLEPEPPAFPFVALLVSGGHTQLMEVRGIGQYALLGETLDDAAGEAFDKTAKLLGLGYPGGPALSRLAAEGDASRFRLPRPMLRSGDLNFSFSGLKTAVLNLTQQQTMDAAARADVAAAFQDAIVEVLTAKCLAALKQTGHKRLVVAGGVGANRQLREALDAACARRRAAVHYPRPAFCTDNGAMIAFAGAMRLGGPRLDARRFGIRPRWDLASLPAVG